MSRCKDTIFKRNNEKIFEVFSKNMVVLELN